MPILLLLKSNWKLIGIVMAILGIFYGGYHVRGIIDAAAAQKILLEQMQANQKAQDDLNTKARNVETELASERQKSSELTKRWSKLNAQKHNVCNLSSDVKQLLKDATSNTDSNAR